MLGINLQETRFYQEAKEDGREEGRREMVLSQLEWKFGEPSLERAERVSGLSLAQLEALGKALFSFESTADLDAWFANVQPSDEEG